MAKLLGKQGRIITPKLSQAVGAQGDDEEGSPTGQSAPSGAVFGGSTGTGAPVTQQPAPQTKGSGFTNIQKILKASGTESGAGRLAQKAAGGVRQAATGAQAALAGATSEFEAGKQKAEGELSTRASQINPILTRATTTTSTPNQAQQQQDVESWRSVVGGGYSGPTELGMSAEQQRKAAQSAALSKLAGDTSGRSALLQKYVGSPQYGESKQRLDALLLGRGGAGQIRSALREGSRAEQNIKRQQIVAQEQAKQLQQRASGIAEEAKSALAGKERGVLKQVGETKESFVGGLGAARTRVIDALNKGGQVSKSDLDLLGIKPEDLPVASAPGFASANLNKFLSDVSPFTLTELQKLGLQKANNRTGETVDQIQKRLATVSDPNEFFNLMALEYKGVDNKTRPGAVGSYDFTNFAPAEEGLKDYYNTLSETQFANPEQIAQLTALSRLGGSGYTDLGEVYKGDSSAPKFDIDQYRTYIDQKNNEYIENDPIYFKAKKIFEGRGDQNAKNIMDKRRNQLINHLQQSPLSVSVV